MNLIAAGSAGIRSINKLRVIEPSINYADTPAACTSLIHLPARCCTCLGPRHSHDDAFPFCSERCSCFLVANVVCTEAMQVMESIEKMAGSLRMHLTPTLVHAHIYLFRPIVIALYSSGSTSCAPPSFTFGCISSRTLAVTIAQYLPFSSLCRLGDGVGLGSVCAQ